jgi:hypothetical protein
MGEKDDIDRMFEEMFGYGGAEADTPTPPQERKKRPRTPKVPDPTPEAVERAARAVRDAVRADKRHRPIKVWRSVVKDALGVKRLKVEWWDAVIAKGVELRLFRVDEETLSYPQIIVFDDPEPEVEPEPKTPEPWTPPPMPPRKPPEERRYAYHLACGHRSNWLRKRKGEDGAEEIYCQACELRTPPDHVWMSVNRGVPIPPRRRRSEQYPQGHCCDADGQYIGGLEGDCRYGHLKDPNKPVCDYHADKPLWGRKG